MHRDPLLRMSGAYFGTTLGVCIRPDARHRSLGDRGRRCWLAVCGFVPQGGASDSVRGPWRPQSPIW